MPIHVGTTMFQVPTCTTGARTAHDLDEQPGRSRGGTTTLFRDWRFTAITHHSAAKHAIRTRLRQTPSRRGFCCSVNQHVPITALRGEDT